MSKCIKFECRYCEDRECCSSPLREDCSFNDCPLGYSCNNCTNFDDNEFSCTLIVEDNDF